MINAKIWTTTSYLHINFYDWGPLNIKQANLFIPNIAYSKSSVLYLPQLQSSISRQNIEDSGWSAIPNTFHYRFRIWPFWSTTIYLESFCQFSKSVETDLGGIFHICVSCWCWIHSSPFGSVMSFNFIGTCPVMEFHTFINWGGCELLIEVWKPIQLYQQMINNVQSL